ncbi:MAG: isoleucine--tRNA ligase [Candidatus Lokiarchaeota archaeon]|nr:isoleucine--tRNA ligase [Candidatus Lokiarchaeota archaeon]
MRDLGKLDSLQLEERILKWWECENIYELIKQNEPEKRVWRFIDGPPYTSGDVHLGTAWNKIMKDLLIRYKRMRGYKVLDTPGYDTHGLPIEVVMEKKLNIHNKQEIIDYGLDKFIEECRKYAKSMIPIMNEQFKRLGCSFWDWEHPYVTYENTYLQGAWWTLKKAHENGYLYKFYKPQNCCPRCATALAKHEFEYANIKDTAIFVKFQTIEDPKTFFVIWTTTPWTLVANTNIMVNPDIEYVEMRVKDETWIMGIAATTNLLQNKMGLPLNKDEGFSYGRRFNGRELEGKRYIHPLGDEVPMQAELEKKQPKVHTVVLSSEFVSEGEGSGLVHTAPGHGPEDFEVGVRNEIPIFNPVDLSGNYTEEGGYFEGKNVADTNEEIIDILHKKGTLLHQEEIVHEYAHCWRCKTKLVYRATEQWFLSSSAIKDRMIELNQDVYWIPDQAGHLQFESWLQNLQDWCISRQRYWGIPIPIWECTNENCDHLEVIGTAEELEQKAGKIPEDLHKPWIDEVELRCDKCEGVMKRISDVLDVWFDSGSVMWAAQKFYDGYIHYDTWEKADFIIEGKDQIRGWFNSLLGCAVLTSDRRSYDACYMHGWVLSHGIKMSKSLGNKVEPRDVIEGKVEILTERQKELLREEAREIEASKFEKTKKNLTKTRISKRKKKYIKDDKRWSDIKGIETFRFYCVTAAAPGADFSFNYKEYVDSYKVLNTLWNSYVFAQEKMSLNEFDPLKHKFKWEDLTLEDKWIISKTNVVIKELSQILDSYELPKFPQRLQDFILNDVSRWYITLIREKVEPRSEDPLKIQTLAVLWYVLHRLLLVLSPLNPMITEEIYQKMFVDHLKNPKKSVHLEKWPRIQTKRINSEIEEQMELSRQIIEAVRSLKADNKIKLRWPTKGLIIVPKKNIPDLQLMELIQNMANVKTVRIAKETPEGKNYTSVDHVIGKLILDLNDTVELQRERILRDLLRTLQHLRKINDLKTGEPIQVILATKSDFAFDTLQQNEPEIRSKISAESFTIEREIHSEENGWIHHQFYFCLNKGCYASIRKKHIDKIREGKDYSCDYCEKLVTEENLGEIDIRFKKL